MLQLDRQRRKTCQIPYCVIPIYGPDIYCFFLRKLKYSVRIYTVVNQLIKRGTKALVRVGCKCISKQGPGIGMDCFDFSGIIYLFSAISLRKLTFFYTVQIFYTSKRVFISIR